MNTLRSIWIWTAVTVLILVWVPLMAVVRATDRDPGRYRTGRWLRRLGSAMTHLNPAWRVRITGSRPDNPRQPFVVVANHQSQADIPVISRLPWDMKWVAKEAMFHVPVVGWMMRIAGDIPVDRKDRKSRSDVLLHARERLEHRVSVMFFPEGTRSRDGRIGRFADGAFRLAIQTGTPILPLALDGTTHALPARSWRFGPPSSIRLHVFEPVSVDGLDLDDTAELRARVRLRIRDQVAAWRQVPPDVVDAGA